MRHSLPLLALLALAACASAPPEAEVVLPESASSLPLGAPESLPPDLWTTRVGGGMVEAAVSDGAASVGIACPDGERLFVRYRPPQPPRERAEVAFSTARQRARVDLVPRGENLRGSVEPDDPLGLVLAAVAEGQPLIVSVDGRSNRFAANGAADALADALDAPGCTAPG